MAFRHGDDPVPRNFGERQDVERKPDQPGSLTRVRYIGALIERKFFYDKALSRSRGSPRCRQSVTRTGLRLHLLKAARLLRRSMVAPSPATPVRCEIGRASCRERV